MTSLAAAPPRNTRWNAVCPYFTMFPLSFPYERLADANPGDCVLDPFCGRGTTLFAARLRGLPSIGIDVNPVAVAVARAKLLDIGVEEVVRLSRALLDRRDVDVPQGPFWSWCYERSTLADLCRVRRGLLGRDDDVAVVLRAVILGILHGPLRRGAPTYLSNQMPRTYATKPAGAVRYWRSRRMRPPRVDVCDAIERRARFSLSHSPPATRGEVVAGDIRTVRRPAGMPKATWIITSPPYPGMRTYLPDQWLRNWFLGGPADVDYHCPGQLPHGVETFADGLADAWRAVASMAKSGARLVVRFGVLPSSDLDATEILTTTLENSSASWRVVDVRCAGAAPRGRRQAVQFKRCAPDASKEIDLEAILN